MTLLHGVKFEGFVKLLSFKRGMTQLAKDTGMGRESLYKALSGEGNPSFGAIQKVAKALGLSIKLQAN